MDDKAFENKVNRDIDKAQRGCGCVASWMRQRWEMMASPD